MVGKLIKLKTTKKTEAIRVINSLIHKRGLPNVFESNIRTENDVEQFIKADRLRMSRPLQNSKVRAMLRRLNSTVPY